MGVKISENYNNKSEVAQFLSFLNTVKKEGLFKGTLWGLSDGHATSYMDLEQFIPAVLKQIKSKIEKGSPISEYYVWNIQKWKFDSKKIKDALNKGFDGILELGRNNPDVVFDKISTDWKSEEKEEFAKAMGSGEFGSLDESDLGELGDELADAIKDELEDKKKELKEFVDPISILSYILASTTLVNIIAKYVGKFFKKYNFEKGEKGAKTIYDFTHKLEEDFKSPIKRVVKLFTKDEKTVNIVTNGLYALVILSLGVKAGGGAVQDLAKGNVAHGSISGLKAALKGKDLSTLIKDIAKAAA